PLARAGLRLRIVERTPQPSELRERDAQRPLVIVELAPARKRLDRDRLADGLADLLRIGPGELELAGAQTLGRGRVGVDGVEEAGEAQPEATALVGGRL